MTDKLRSITIKSNIQSPSSSFPLGSCSEANISSTLNEQFADIIQRYKYYCQHIQRILEDTEKSYNEIKYAHVLSSGTNDLT